MSNRPKTLPTVGVIARQMGCPVHVVCYVIRTRRIQPLGKAGNAYVYSDADVGRIAHEIQRIQAEKGEETDV